MKNKYSIYSKCKLFIWLIRTKLIAHQARIIRFPFDIRGRKYIDIGRRLTTGVGCRLEAFSEDGKKKMFFGSDVQLNDYVHINAMCRVEIGNNVLIASHVYISDNSHGIYKGTLKDSRPDVPPIKRDYYIKPVSIGNNSWICEGVLILPGVKIGIGCILGAHSVVNKNIPDYSIAVGNPAYIIKRYDFTRNGWFKTDSQGNFLN